MGLVCLEGYREIYTALILRDIADARGCENPRVAAAKVIRHSETIDTAPHEIYGDGISGGR
jgi:hypothetical protein